MIKFLGLGKKPEPEKMKPLEKPVGPKPVGKGLVPTDEVKKLSSKGFSEPEIIDILRKEGFSADEIDRALTQSLKIGVTGEQQSPQQLPTLKELQTQQGMPMYDEGYGLETQPPMAQQTFQPSSSPMQKPIPEQSQEYYPPTDYGTEEVVESVVQERMSELDQRFSEMKRAYSDLDRKITDLHHRLSIMSKGKTQSEQTIISKIDAFKDTLNDIDARLSSLEKAFKEALPALIESVRSLTDLVQRFKREA